MRKTVMRGGVDDYKLNEILGKKFQQIMPLLESGYDSFLWKTIKDKIPAPNTAKKPEDNDIWYELPQFLIAATAAFRYIETPDVGKITVAGSYYEAVGTIFDELIAEIYPVAMTKPKKYPFGFDQLPFNYKSGTIKHLVPGFHLLKYIGSAYFDVPPVPGATTHGSLIDVILYLYHYIALLDTKGLDPIELITFLRSDNFIFATYLNDLIEIFASSDYFSASTGFPIDDAAIGGIIERGLVNGLTAIATQIINEFDKVPPSNAVAAKSLDKTDFNVGADITGYFVSLGIDATKAAALTTAFKAIKKPLNPGTNANKITDGAKTISPDRLKKYAMDSLLNPTYVSTAAAKTVESTDLVEIIPAISQIGGKTRYGRSYQYGGIKNRRGNRSYQSGGKFTPKKKSATAGTDTVSLPYLYGPVVTVTGHADLGKRNLTTVDVQGDQGTKAELVDPANGTIITALIALIENSGTANDTDSTIAKIHLLAILYYLLENNVATVDTPLNKERDAITAGIQMALNGYRYVVTRLRKIPNAANKLFAELNQFRDAFVNEFTKETSRYLTRTATGLSTVPGGPTLPGQPMTTPVAAKPHTLATPDIKKFYKETIVPEPGFYDEYFNLVRLEPTAGQPASGDNVPLLEAANLTDDAELAKYRLNVKKEKGRSYLVGSQTGGAYGDIILFSKIPALTPEITGMWLNEIARLTRDELKAWGGDQAMKDLVRKVWAAPAGPTIKLFDIDIRLFDAITKASKGLFDVNYQTLLNSLIANALAGKAPGLTSAWKKSDFDLTEHMLKERSKWEREDNTFVKKNDKGEIIDHYGDQCALIKENPKDCLDFFTGCLSAKGDKFPDACKELMDFSFNFEVNTPINDLADNVAKMNPAVAFQILKKFGFAYYETEGNEPVRGFHRYKVQSVGSWLEELLAESKSPNQLGGKRGGRGQRGQRGQRGGGGLRDYLGKDIADTIASYAMDDKKRPFFNYLDVLVNWVNANPQTLNKEESKPCEFEEEYGEINKSFKTYSYRNPYKAAELRIRDVSCGLERLKSSIMNELTGAQGASIINSITSVPIGIQMPLARPGFTDVNPLANYFPVPMMGGGGDDFEYEIRDINNQYGYGLFEQLYKDLVQTMESLRGSKKICLSGNSTANIKSKLDSFKRCEEDLRKSIVQLMVKNKLYQASRGYVNPYAITDENDFKAILSKHSNLLNLSQTYNKKANNMIDLFQTITKAILGKIESPSSDTQTQRLMRPLTADYPPKKN